MIKRRISLLVMVVLLAVTAFGVLSTPKTAHAGGGGGYFCAPNGYHDSWWDWGTAIEGIYKDVYSLPSGQVLTAYYAVHNHDGYYTVDLDVSVSDCTTTFHDGRINNRDAGQTVAIYCTGGETGGIWTLIPGKPVWKLGLVVTAAEINAVKANPNHPVLIKKKGHVSLYRLQDGSLQINAPGINPTKEDYNFIFNNCI